MPLSKQYAKDAIENSFDGDASKVICADGQARVFSSLFLVAAPVANNSAGAPGQFAIGSVAVPGFAGAAGVYYYAGDGVTHAWIYIAGLS